MGVTTHAPAARPRRHRGSHRRPRRRHQHRWLAAAALAASLALGLIVVVEPELWSVGGPTSEQIRPLSSAEAQRLASMRQRNWEQRWTGVRANVASPAGAVQLTGWLDWHHPMIYVGRTDPDTREITELLQAVPGLVAYRPARRASERLSHLPANPPAEGWRLRHPSIAGIDGQPTDAGTLDTLLGLLLSLAAPGPDSAPLLAGSEARWLRQDEVAGVTVDVLLAPAVLPAAAPESAGSSAQASEGSAQYWLDSQANLHRFTALLTEQTVVEVNLDRHDQTTPPVIDLLGGPALDPRPVTESEAQTLSLLPVRHREVAGGELTISLPGPAGQRRATGWLDWHRPVAYLATYRDGAPDGLLWADPAGVATRSDRPPRAGMPPVPAPPADGGWGWQSWSERGDGLGPSDLDILVRTALSMSGWHPYPVASVRDQARWLRSDNLAGTPVSVYELPRPTDLQLPAGAAPLRYWLDDERGVLLRLELRTPSGGFGHLDLSPGTAPPL